MALQQAPIFNANSEAPPSEFRIASQAFGAFEESMWGRVGCNTGPPRARAREPLALKVHLAVPVLVTLL